MANYPLQISIWILGITALAGNIFVVVWRTATERKQVSSFFIVNLAASDGLMGVYLLIIAGVDQYYRGTYIVHSASWRASALCQLAGVLATLSSELSVFMLTAITADRATTLLFPLKFGQMRMKQARLVAAAAWIVCIFISVLPVTKIPYFGNAFFGKTGQ